MNQADLEQEAYHQLGVYTLTRGDPGFMHQYAVDAFAAQRANERTKPISLAFALIGLYLHVERNETGRQVQHVHMLLARRRKQWPTFELPEHRGDITVLDVMRASAGPERDEMIRTWSASVWEAYRSNRARVVELLLEVLG